MKDLDRDKNYLTNKEIRKQHDIATDNTVYCKCGHSVTLTNRFGRVICNWCGSWVYASEEAKRKYEKQAFVYKMKGLLKK